MSSSPAGHVQALTGQLHDALIDHPYFHFGKVPYRRSRRLATRGVPANGRPVHARRIVTADAEQARAAAHDALEILGR